MGLLSYVPLLDDLVKWGREATVDKDKQNELNYKIKELRHTFDMTLLTAKTVPWVDAIVKIMYASVALARPLGTFAMTAFALWAYKDGIELPESVHMAVTSAFPAWAAVRTHEKKQGVSAVIPTPTVGKPERRRRHGPRK